jgi:sugar-specific transcriptional regulator TrmB
MNIFTTLGFTSEEGKIYRILCERDILTLAGVAKVTGIHRPRLYSLLPSMIEKNYLTEHTVGKRQYYKAIEPLALYEQIQKQLSVAADEIDSLQILFEKSQHKPEVSFHIGEQGYQKAFDDIAEIVPKGATIFRYSARTFGDDSFRSSKKYRDRRAKGHFDRLVITSEKKGREKSKRIDRLVKVIPESYDVFDDNVSQMMYEDRTVMIDHDNKSVFIIKSAKIASIQKKLFKLLWKYLDEPKNR